MDNYLEEKYGMLPAPQTMAALLTLSSLPDFKSDPTSRKGMVILDEKWVEEYIVWEWFPIIGHRECHRLMAAPLYAALAEIAASPYNDHIDPRSTGILVFRRTGWREGNRLSTHALGLAIDINWNENPYRKRGGRLVSEAPWIVNTFKKYGFVWGGHWRTADEMHLQYLGSEIRLPR